MNDRHTTGTSDSGNSIAIVGMVGRFPGAPDTDTLWRRLVAGDDCVSGSIGSSPFTVDGRWSRDGGIGIPAGYLDGFDRFDAAFFGLSPLEARITDPQHRLVLEAAWAALEDAGHGDPGALRVGVFATASQSGYLWTNVRANAAVLAATDDTQLALGNAPDFLASRVAFKLGLRGPAISVQAACASSLVAVHLAARSLLAGECDLAVVASASVTVSPWCRTDQHGTPVASSTGTRCRSFSADAEHTVTADGVVAVVLRRLDDATRGRDEVRAVIRGSAVNNDGAVKMGFATPAVDGQVEVVRQALAAAGVDPATVGYVEGHGSGTPIGDSIELTALGEAYGPHPDGSRLLGSVKSNIGYLDGTAGLVGLVKTVLALRHELIPPNLHFTKAHEQTAGFTVVTTPTPWPRGDAPRRAGVGAYAMGGTNVHLLVEEAPATAGAPHRPGPRRRYAVLTASGATAAAADAAADRLTAHLTAAGRGIDLRDAEYTLHLGRRAFGHRRAAVLAADDPVDDVPADAWTAGTPRPGTPTVVFRFPAAPGVEEHATAALAGAGAEFAATEPGFAQAVAECVDLLAARHGLGLPFGRSPAGLAPAPAAVVAVTAWYALVRLLRGWGVTPAMAVGVDRAGAAIGRAAVRAATGAADLATVLADILDLPDGRGPTHGAGPAAPADGVVVDMLGCLGGPGLATALAKVWTAGVDVDWSGYHTADAPRRVPLPTYPFQCDRYWVEPDPTPRAGGGAGDPAARSQPPAADRWDEEFQRMVAAGTDPIEAAVSGVWCEVLGVAVVGATDDFFALGGDSLRLLRVTGRLRDLFGLEIPLADAFAARRIDQLIGLLEDLVIREAVG